MSVRRFFVSASRVFPNAGGADFFVFAGDPHGRSQKRENNKSSINNNI